VKKQAAKKRKPDEVLDIDLASMCERNEDIDLGIDLTKLIEKKRPRKKELSTWLWGVDCDKKGLSPERALKKIAGGS